MKITGTTFLVRKKRIDSVRQMYHMFIFRHRKYTFLQLTLIGMKNFAIPGQNAHDYYRNKLILNMAGTLLMWYTDTYTAVLENLLMCDLLMHAQTFGTLPILKPVLKKWDIEFLKE